MRSFGYLLLFVYMLGLSLLPCGSESACAEDEIAASSGASDGPEHEDHPESCSPFCICSCCSFQVLFHNEQIKITPVFTCIQTYYSSNPSFLNKVSRAIWQPPKIA